MVMANRGVTDILADLAKEFTSLFRTEIRLARAEMSDKIALLGMSLALMVAGAVFVMAALVLVLQAVVALLMDQGFSPPAAILIVAGSAVVLGAVLIWVGSSQLRARNLAPSRTVEQLQRDAAVARHKMVVQ